MVFKFAKKKKKKDFPGQDLVSTVKKFPGSMKTKLLRYRCSPQRGWRKQWEISSDTSPTPNSRTRGRPSLHVSQSVTGHNGEWDWKLMWLMWRRWLTLTPFARHTPWHLHMDVLDALEGPVSRLWGDWLRLLRKIALVRGCWLSSLPAIPVRKIFYSWFPFKF